MTAEITNVKYTTLDRTMTFTFDFVQYPNGEWLVFIVDGPEYGGRPNGVAAHRLHNPRGDYICWVPGPRTLDEAKGVARAWADATHAYIRTGTFPSPGPARHVPDLSTSAAWEFRGHVGVVPEPPPALTAPPPPPNPSIPLVREPMYVTAPQPSGWRGLFTRRNR